MKNFQTIIGLVVIATLMRFVPHAPNFTPILGLAIFSGAMFENKKAAILITLAAMFISDIFLEFHSTMPVVYISLILIIFLGSLLQKTSVLKNSSLDLKATASIMGVSFLSAVLFFIISNFGVWASQDLYPKTPAGLMLCYVEGIPFFSNTLISAVMYSLLLFLGYSKVAQKKELLAN